MKRLLTFCIFLSIFGTHQLFSQDSQVKQVSALLDQYALARHEKDAMKASSMMASDPFFKYIYNGFITTKKEWIEYQSESWARMSDYSFRWKDKKIKMLGKNSAIATCISSLSYRIKGGPWGPGATICTITFEMVDSNWAISSIHESTYATENRRTE